MLLKLDDLSDGEMFIGIYALGITAFMLFIGGVGAPNLTMMEELTLGAIGVATSVLTYAGLTLKQSIARSRRIRPRGDRQLAMQLLYENGYAPDWVGMDILQAETIERWAATGYLDREMKRVEQVAKNMNSAHRAWGMPKAKLAHELVRH